MTKRRIFWRISGLLALLLAVGAGVAHHYLGALPVHVGARADDPAPMVAWPWPHAKTGAPHPGVKHWIDRSSFDGTIVELFDFDFRANPHLRLELYDQDQDDQTPFDNHAGFWDRGVAQVTRHLNENGRGQVVAAWNGLFFQYSNNIAGHVAPVVLGGKALYNVGVVRWSVGVKYQRGMPVFKVMRLPDFHVLAKEYDYAAEGASCLILDGQPLRLRAFPKPDEDPFPPSKQPGPGEAGFVRKVDHIRTSRTSMAWSKDNRHFYLLIVKAPEAEVSSIMALRNHLPIMGGWTVADEQRFWDRFGVWCAVNLDGGDVTQMATLRQDGRYDLVPAHWANTSMRLTYPPDFKSAPAGGSLMYFFVRDTSTAK